MCKHKTLLLVFIAWPDNFIVKLLSNFHSPIIIQNAVWCLYKIDGVRQHDTVGVPVLEQQKDYSKTYYKIY